jgi:UDP-GlcNAc:undecaprenyl-phosphate GlcNAc-1-phosphate transferase
MIMVESLLVAFLLSVFLISIFRPLAPRFGLVDAPSLRKRHDGAIPLVGGLGVYATVLVFSLIYPFWNAQHGTLLIVLGAVLLLVGIADDRWDLSASRRLVIEICCSLIAIYYGGVRLDDLGQLLPGFGGSLVLLAVPLTVVGMVGAVNAMNMTDGVDGLAGGLAVLTLGTLSVLAWPKDPNIALQLASLVAAIVGFLVFNSRFFGRSRAVIFMGDGGSIFIGFAIVWYLIVLSQGPQAVIRPVSALWFFAIPLIDTVTIMIRRIRRGTSPFAADREHLHHILMLAGFGVNRTVLIILATQLLCIFFGVAVIRFSVPDWVVFGLFVVLFGFYYSAMNHAWIFMKRIKSFREWAGFEDRRCESRNPSGRRARTNTRRLGLDDEIPIQQRRSSTSRRVNKRR